MTEDRIRVALADDDVLLREGLASLLERSGFDVVGQCAGLTGMSVSHAAETQGMAFVYMTSCCGGEPGGLFVCRSTKGKP